LRALLAESRATGATQPAVKGMAGARAGAGAAGRQACGEDRFPAATASSWSLSFGAANAHQTLWNVLTPAAGERRLDPLRLRRNESRSRSGLQPRASSTGMFDQDMLGDDLEAGWMKADVRRAFSQGRGVSRADRAHGAGQ